MKPNVLLITVDDMNYDSPGMAGCSIPGITPNIDRLAAEGMQFVNSHVTIAVCQPSRSVLMTGRYPHRNGALGFEPIAQDVTTLQEQLRAAGYWNGIIGKEDHLAPLEKYCWDSCISTMNKTSGYGRDPKVYYEQTKFSVRQAKEAGKPFFLMVNSHDPHRPFAGSRDELARYGQHTPVRRTIAPEEVDLPGFLPDLPKVREEVAEYFTSVHRADETVGEIMRALKESGEEDHTLVMFLSDNGMAFPFAKTNCYLNSTRTPWVIRWPNHIQPGRVDSKHFISGIDYMPTVLEAAGLPPVEGMDGRSFLPLLTESAEQPERDHVFTMFNRTSGNKDYPMRCMQNVTFGYIWNDWSDQQTVFKNESQDGLTFKAMVEGANENLEIAQRVQLFLYRVREELYDFSTDPDAFHNLIDEPGYADIANDLRRRLFEVMQASDDPRTAAFKREVGF
ncbi:sulfatase family protein [Paenibacillus cremeus]|uniref:Sulfatase n=1 Tax=Paenibacillus cremeus TaxID=2163881 RepID=A0A559KGU7_9BACL|nr:sulfatase [Paenibacillus cremeus]TVY11308.1 sulfatase [Paenibacillus cremeus]